MQGTRFAYPIKKKKPRRKSISVSLKYRHPDSFKKYRVRAGKAVESPSLNIFKTKMGKVSSNPTQLWGLTCFEQDAGPDNHLRPSPPPVFLRLYTKEILHESEIHVILAIKQNYISKLIFIRNWILSAQSQFCGKYKICSARRGFSWTSKKNAFTKNPLEQTEEGSGGVTNLRSI